jgi:hypothetical protein
VPPVIVPTVEFVDVTKFGVALVTCRGDILVTIAVEVLLPIV